MTIHVYPTVSRHSILDAVLARKVLVILLLAIMAWMPIIAAAGWLMALGGWK